jgi:hypothetical protein
MIKKTYVKLFYVTLYNDTNYIGMIVDQAMLNLLHRRESTYLHRHQLHTIIHVNIGLRRNKLINHQNSLHSV